MTAVPELTAVPQCAKSSSKVGEGSIFTVTVPITEAPVKQPEKPWRGKEQWQDRILAGRTVLVVDDDHAVLTALEMLLEDWGMHVVRAGAFEEVAELLSRRTGAVLRPCAHRLSFAQRGDGRPGDRTGPAEPLPCRHRRSGDDRGHIAQSG